METPVVEKQPMDQNGTGQKRAVPITFFLVVWFLLILVNVVAITFIDYEQYFYKHRNDVPAKGPTNAFIRSVRQQVPDDPRTDDELTLLAAQLRPELANQYPDFKADLDRIARSQFIHPDFRDYTNQGIILVPKIFFIMVGIIFFSTLLFMGLRYTLNWSRLQLNKSQELVLWTLSWVAILLLRTAVSFLHLDSMS